MISRFANGGQVCTCNERMYIQSGVYDQVVEDMLKKVDEATGIRRRGLVLSGLLLQCQHSVLK